MEQLNDFSSVWILSCFIRLLEALNALSHFEQLNGFSSLWILSWAFKLPNVLNFLLHFEQLKGFSSVWILSWVFKWSVLLNDLPHFEQLMGFLKVAMFPVISELSVLLVTSLLMMGRLFNADWSFSYVLTSTVKILMTVQLTFKQGQQLKYVVPSICYS